MKKDESVLGVTVFGAMPFKVGRRQIGMKANGEPIWGPLEKKGSYYPNDKPATKTGRRRKTVRPQTVVSR